MALPSSASMATTEEALSFYGGMGDDTDGYDSDNASEGFEDDEIPNLLTGHESKTSSTEPDLTVFRTNLSIVMKHVINTDQTVDWENELAQKTSEQWCNELYPFVPTQVKVAFNNPDRPPTVNELWSLPFFGKCRGNYVDILRHPLSELVSRVYSGTATHRKMGARRSIHNKVESSLGKYPASLYYKVKHGGFDYESHFFTFAQIPISMDMSAEDKGLRRVLCRVAETVTTVWMDLLDPSVSDDEGLRQASKTSLQEMYPPTGRELEWVGVNSHSPLKETTGKHDYGGAYLERYTELMAEYAKLYNGEDNIPADVKAKIETRAKWSDETRQQKDRQRKSYDEDPENRAKRAEYNRRKRKERDEDRVEESKRYFARYYVDMKAAMTEEDKADFAVKSRKAVVKYRLKLGEITQADYDAAEGNGWHMPGAPRRPYKRFSDCSPAEQAKRRATATASRKRDVARALRVGVIGQRHYDAAKANDWYSTDLFPKGWAGKSKAAAKAAKNGTGKAKSSSHKTTPMQPLASLAQAPTGPLRQTSIKDMFGKK